MPTSFTAIFFTSFLIYISQNKPKKPNKKLRIYGTRKRRRLF